jgi:heat shock protein HslJ
MAGPRVRLLLVAAAVILVVGATSCARPPSAGGASDDLDGAWVLTGGTADAEVLQPLPDAPVTLVVAGQEASGRSACNHYGATLRRDGDAIGVSNVGGTEMGCEPHVMELERRYVGALMAVTAARRGEETLTLTGPAVRLDFALEPPVPTADLVGTTWVLESVLDGDTAASPSGRARLRLDEDGTLVGSTGCREFRGRYRVHGSEVVLSELDATVGRDRCTATSRDQDEHVLTVLEGFRAVVEGDLLTLTARDGRGLQLRAAT